MKYLYFRDRHWWSIYISGIDIDEVLRINDKERNQNSLIAIKSYVSYFISFVLLYRGSSNDRTILQLLCIHRDIFWVSRHFLGACWFKLSVWTALIQAERMDSADSSWAYGQRWFKLSVWTALIQAESMDSAESKLSVWTALSQSWAYGQRWVKAKCCPL